MVEKNMIEPTTNATASVGIIQYFLPAANTALQTVFLVVSIVWVLTQIYFKWFRPQKGPNDSGLL